MTDTPNGNGGKSFANWITGTYRFLLMGAVSIIGWFAADKLDDINSTSERMVQELRTITQKIIDSDSRVLAIEGRVSVIEIDRAKNLPFRFTTRDADAAFRLRDAKDSEQDRRIQKAEDRLDGIDGRLNRQGLIIKPGEGVR